jgi:hypothetical protein
MKTSKVLQGACRALRSKVRFERASFALPSSIEGRMANQEDTNAIRAATRLYMESWVIPIIDAIEAGDTRLLHELTKGA